jgi:uncharacterized membrane protein
MRAAKASIAVLMVETLTLMTDSAQDGPAVPQASWAIMHEGGSDTTWLMPLIMIVWSAAIIVVIILMYRLLKDRDAGTSASTRTAQRILDERYAQLRMPRDTSAAQASTIIANPP